MVSDFEIRSLLVEVSLAHLEIIKYLEQTLESWNYGFGEVSWFYLFANLAIFALAKNAKALLYTNMTPTKTLEH